MGRYVSSSRISQVGGSESTKVNPHYGRADWQYKNNSLAASGASSCSALGFDPKKSRYQNRCLYTTPGLYQFTVPSGVTTINTVVVGPGGYADHTLLPMCVDIRLMPASWFCCSRCCSDNNNNSYHARYANEWLGWGSYCGMPCNNPYQHLNAGAPVDAVGPSCVSLEAGMCVHEHAGDPCMRGGCIGCGCGQWTPYRVGFYEQWGQDGDVFCARSGHTSAYCCISTECWNMDFGWCNQCMYPDGGNITWFCMRCDGQTGTSGYNCLQCSNDTFGGFMTCNAPLRCNEEDFCCNGCNCQYTCWCECQIYREIFFFGINTCDCVLTGSCSTQVTNLNGVAHNCGSNFCRRDCWTNTAGRPDKTVSGAGWLVCNMCCNCLFMTPVTHYSLIMQSNRSLYRYPGPGCDSPIITGGSERYSAGYVALAGGGGGGYAERSISTAAGCSYYVCVGCICASNFSRITCNDGSNTVVVCATGPGGICFSDCCIIHKIVFNPECCMRCNINSLNNGVGYTGYCAIDIKCGAWCYCYYVCRKPFYVAGCGFCGDINRCGGIARLYCVEVSNVCYPTGHGGPLSGHVRGCGLETQYQGKMDGGFGGSDSRAYGRNSRIHSSNQEIYICRNFLAKPFIWCMLEPYQSVPPWDPYYNNFAASAACNANNSVYMCPNWVCSGCGNCCTQGVCAGITVDYGNVYQTCGIPWYRTSLYWNGSVQYQCRGFCGHDNCIPKFHRWDCFWDKTGVCPMCHCYAANGLFSACTGGFTACSYITSTEATLQQCFSAYNVSRLRTFCYGSWCQNYTFNDHYNWGVLQGLGYYPLNLGGHSNGTACMFCQNTGAGCSRSEQCVELGSRLGGCNSFGWTCFGCHQGLCISSQVQCPLICCCALHTCAGAGFGGILCTITDRMFICCSHCFMYALPFHTTPTNNMMDCPGVYLVNWAPNMAIANACMLCGNGGCGAMWECACGQPGMGSWWLCNYGCDRGFSFGPCCTPGNGFCQCFPNCDSSSCNCFGNYFYMCMCFRNYFSRGVNGGYCSDFGYSWCDAWAPRYRWAFTCCTPYGSYNAVPNWWFNPETDYRGMSTNVHCCACVTCSSQGCLGCPNGNWALAVPGSIVCILSANNAGYCGSTMCNCAYCSCCACNGSYPGTPGPGIFDTWCCSQNNRVARLHNFPGASAGNYFNDGPSIWQCVIPRACKFTANQTQGFRASGGGTWYKVQNFLCWYLCTGLQRYDPTANTHTLYGVPDYFQTTTTFVPWSGARSANTPCGIVDLCGTWCARCFWCDTDSCGYICPSFGWSNFTPNTCKCSDGRYYWCRLRCDPYCVEDTWRLCTQTQGSNGPCMCIPYASQYQCYFYQCATYCPGGPSCFRDVVHCNQKNFFNAGPIMDCLVWEHICCVSKTANALYCIMGLYCCDYRNAQDIQAGPARLGDHTIPTNWIFGCNDNMILCACPGLNCMANFANNDVLCFDVQPVRMCFNGCCVGSAFGSFCGSTYLCSCHSSGCWLTPNFFWRNCCCAIHRILGANTAAEPQRWPVTTCGCGGCSCYGMCAICCGPGCWCTGHNMGFECVMNTWWINTSPAVFWGCNCAGDTNGWGNCCACVGSGCLIPCRFCNNYMPCYNSAATCQCCGIPFGNDKWRPITFSACTSGCDCWNCFNKNPYLSLWWLFKYDNDTHCGGSVCGFKNGGFFTCGMSTGFTMALMNYLTNPVTNNPFFLNNCHCNGSNVCGNSAVCGVWSPIDPGTWGIHPPGGCRNAVLGAGQKGARGFWATNMHVFRSTNLIAHSRNCTFCVLNSTVLCCCFFNSYYAKPRLDKSMREGPEDQRWIIAAINLNNCCFGQPFTCCPGPGLNTRGCFPCNSWPGSGTCTCGAIEQYCCQFRLFHKTQAQLGRDYMYCTYFMPRNCMCASISNDYDWLPCHCQWSRAAWNTECMIFCTGSVGGGPKRGRMQTTLIQDDDVRVVCGPGTGHTMFGPLNKPFWTCSCKTGMCFNMPCDPSAWSANTVLSPAGDSNIGCGWFDTRQIIGGGAWGCIGVSCTTKMETCTYPCWNNCSVGACSSVLYSVWGGAVCYLNCYTGHPPVACTAAYCDTGVCGCQFNSPGPNGNLNFCSCNYQVGAGAGVMIPCLVNIFCYPYTTHPGPGGGGMFGCCNSVGCKTGCGGVLASAAGADSYTNFCFQSGKGAGAGWNGVPGTGMAIIYW